MKKILFIVFALAVSATIIKAQQPHVTMSATFDEPDGGWSKLLQLKSGNTFFFHFTKKSGIEVTVYDKNHKEIASKTLEGDLWEAKKMTKSVVDGIYEIKGEPVIFLVQAAHNIPTLYRIRLNGNTGAIVDEKELGALPKINMFDGYAMAFGHLDIPDIIVEKDPASDCYAVVYFNSFAHEPGGRIRVEHYNGQHQVISNAYFNAPNNKYKYIRFIGMMVDADKRVYLCTYAFNTAAYGGKNSSVIVSKLNAHDTDFKSQLLDFTEDFHNTKSVMQYNHSTNQIVLLTLTNAKSRPGFAGATTYYSSLITYIDPESLAIADSKPLEGEKINAYMHNTLNTKRNYTGVPQQMILNKDHTTTVLSEEMTQEIERDSRGHIKSENTILGGIGVSEIDEHGHEKNGYAINKSQLAYGLIDPLYISQKGKGKWSFRTGSKLAASRAYNNAFLSYDYVNTDQGRYILFNDIPKNYDKRESKRKRKTVMAVSKTNTVCYKLTNGEMSKYYLFGEPKSNDKSNFCYIESSDYYAEQNTYATLLVQRDGRDKQARIAWVTFE